MITFIFFILPKKKEVIDQSMSPKNFLYIFNIKLFKPELHQDNLYIYMEFEIPYIF